MDWIPQFKRNSLLALFFTATRIQMIKFSFCTYEQSSVGLEFSGKPYEPIISQNVEAECCPYTESIWLKYLFPQETSFTMYVKPRIISELTRRFLSNPQKRTRKQTRRSTTILGFSNLNS